MRLTKSALIAITPTEKRQIIFDDSITGLAVRVGSSGHMAFYYYYRLGKGRASPRKKIHLGTFPAMSIEQARDRAKQLFAGIINGRDPAREIQEAKEAQKTAKAAQTAMSTMSAKSAKSASTAGTAKAAEAAMTLGDYLNLFLTEYVHVYLAPKTIELYDGLARNHIMPALGALKLEDVAHRDIARLHTSLKDKKYMGNRVLAVLSRFFGWSETNGWRPRNTNPTVDVLPFKEEKKMDFLGKEDLAAIGAALSQLEAEGQVPSLVAAALKLLVLTGARKMEILSLKWKDINFEENTAKLFKTKTGYRILQLSVAAVEILSGLPRFNEFVFPSTSSASGHLTDVRKGWCKVVAQADLTGRWRPHDLRHAFASAAVNYGASLPMIGALLGHSQPSTTARYAHVAKSTAHKLADDNGARIAAALEATEATPKPGIIQFRPKVVENEG